MQAADTAATAVFERDDWWRGDGAFRLLHDINPLRLRWLQTQCDTLHGKRLLDVGCGGGIFAEAAARAGAEVTGVDAAAHAIRIAREHAAESKLNITYHHTRQEEGLAALPPAQYDVITCFEVLEHLREPQLLVADIAARLKPGGVAAFSTINRTPHAWALLVLMLEYVLKTIPARTHDYQLFVPPAQLARACQHSKLAVTDICGMQYSFFGHYYRLTPADTGVNYFLAARRDAH